MPAQSMGKAREGGRSSYDGEATGLAPTILQDPTSFRIQAMASNLIAMTSNLMSTPD